MNPHPTDMEYWTQFRFMGHITGADYNTFVTGFIPQYNTTNRFYNLFAVKTTTGAVMHSSTCFDFQVAALRFLAGAYECFVASTHPPRSHSHPACVCVLPLWLCHQACRMLSFMRPRCSATMCFCTPRRYRRSTSTTPPTAPTSPRSIPSSKACQVRCSLRGHVGLLCDGAVAHTTTMAAPDLPKINMTELFSVDVEEVIGKCGGSAYYYAHGTYFRWVPASPYITVSFDTVPLSRDGST